MKRLFVILILLQLMTSCHQNELFYHDDAVSVLVEMVWDYSQVPPGDVPLFMHLHFYNLENGESFADLTTKDGGYIDVPFGDFAVLTYNAETEYLLFRGEDHYSTFEAYTQTIVRTDFSQAKMSIEGMREPDNLFASATPYFKVYPTDGVIILEKTPVNLVRKIPFTVKGIKGVENLSNIRLVVSGMATSVNLSTGEVSAQSSNLFPTFTLTENGFEGSFRTFGHYQDSVEHIFTMELTYGGEKLTHAFDVTQRLDATDRIDIVVDMAFGKIEGEGFNPGVSDWEDEDFILK